MGLNVAFLAPKLMPQVTQAQVPHARASGSGPSACHTAAAACGVLTMAFAALLARAKRHIAVARRDGHQVRFATGMRRGLLAGSQVG